MDSGRLWSPTREPGGAGAENIPAGGGGARGERERQAWASQASRSRRERRILCNADKKEGQVYYLKLQREAQN